MVGTYRAGAGAGASSVPMRPTAIHDVDSGCSRYWGWAALGLLWALWPTARTEPATGDNPVGSAAGDPAGHRRRRSPPPRPSFGRSRSTSRPIPRRSGRTIRRASSARPNTSRPIRGLRSTSRGSRTRPAERPTNEELAKERAKAVRGALVAAGVPESRTNLAPPASVTGGASRRRGAPRGDPSEAVRRRRAPGGGHRQPEAGGCEAEDATCQPWLTTRRRSGPAPQGPDQGCVGRTGTREARESLGSAAADPRDRSPDRTVRVTRGARSSTRWLVWVSDGGAAAATEGGRKSEGRQTGGHEREAIRGRGDPGMKA